MDEKLYWQKLSVRIFQKTNKFAVLPLETKTGMHGWMDGWMGGCIIGREKITCLKVVFITESLQPHQVLVMQSTQ
jgi:hypothetical protein